MLQVFQKEISILYPSERINAGVLDLLKKEFLRLHFLVKEHIQGLGVFLFDELLNCFVLVQTQLIMSYY